jgi:erythromycin esterase
MTYLRDAHLVIIPEATHVFEEPGKLEEVAKEAADWFTRYLLKKGRTQPGLRRSDDPVVQAIRERAVPLKETKDLDSLITELSQSKIVMLGEASHGTHEFYEWRRIISEQLIQKHGFSFIAVEGDWPPCWELNQYIRGGAGKSSREALRNFKRWPTWMWANTDVIRLTDWMRMHNQMVPEGKQAGFYGLDVYSLFESIDAILKQLEKINPFLAKRARLRYACFDPYRRDERAYAKSLFEFPEGCEKEVNENLQELLRFRLDGMRERKEALFDAEQNARVIANAERYYRTMVHADESSWNVRDRHMLDTLEALLKHYGEDSKAIVWAHNTHIGDYRATDMAAQGEINIGGLAREKWGDRSVSLVGFGTYQGEVTASHAWDGRIETMNVPPGRPESIEASFHEVSKAIKQKAFYVSLRDRAARSGTLAKTIGHRAIGVVYDPERERFGNYVPTALSHRYDAFVFIDETTALESLSQPFERKEIPETWPSGV